MSHSIPKYVRNYCNTIAYNMEKTDPYLTLYARINSE